MSVFLLSSSLVTTLLIPPAEFEDGGDANGRALAYLAHEYLGNAVRHDVRRLHHRDPVVRRRLGDGGPAQPDPAVPAPVRHGAALGGAVRPLVLVLTGRVVPDHLDLRRRRRRAGRRVRDGRAGAVHQRRGRGDPGRPPAGQRRARRSSSPSITAVFVYTTVSNVDRATGRHQDRGLLHRGDRPGLAGLAHRPRLRAPRPTTVELDETSQVFVRDCARRTIRLVAQRAAAPRASRSTPRRSDRSSATTTCRPSRT